MINGRLIFKPGLYLDKYGILKKHINNNNNNQNHNGSSSDDNNDGSSVFYKSSHHSAPPISVSMSKLEYVWENT
jgi:hypothetical protein